MRTVVTNFVVLASIALVGSGCSEGPLDPQRYSAWLSDPENGLVQHRTFKDVELSLQYRSPEQLALNETRGDARRSDFDTLVAQRRNAHYFNLKLRALHASDLLNAGATDPDAYFQRQYYFGSLVQDDLSLIIGSDTLPCALAHFERTYGAAPYNNLVVSFVDGAEDHANEDLRFVYEDRAFGLGRVQFIINKEDLSRIPALKRS